MNDLALFLLELSGGGLRGFDLERDWERECDWERERERVHGVLEHTERVLWCSGDIDGCPMSYVLCLDVLLVLMSLVQLRFLEITLVKYAVFRRHFACDRVLVQAQAALQRDSRGEMLPSTYTYTLDMDYSEQTGSISRSK